MLIQIFYHSSHTHPPHLTHPPHFTRPPHLTLLHCSLQTPEEKEELQKRVRELKKVKVCLLQVNIIFLSVHDCYHVVVMQET